MRRPDHLSEEAPGYVLHTNRELGFMLRGAKPLAMFYEADGLFVDVVQRYLRIFDRYVRLGVFVRRDHIEPWPDGHTLHRVLFARPEEAWRIDAMIELMSVLKTPGAWTDEHEREEGRLLGYEEWQNDLWLARRRLPLPSGALS